MDVRAKKCIFVANVRAKKNVIMGRNVIKQLLAWKQKKNRKPLIVNGARQVGKTYILRKFGTKYYQNLAYVNCGHPF